MVEIIFDPHLFTATELKSRADVASLRVVVDKIANAKIPVEVIVTDNLRQSYREYFQKWSEIPQGLAKTSLEFFIQHFLMGAKATLRTCSGAHSPPCVGCADISKGIECFVQQYLIESEQGCKNYSRDSVPDKITVNLFGESTLFDILSTENIQEIVNNRVSSTTWDRLPSDSRLFLQTALVTWQHFQDANAYDYLSVCGPLSKTVEVELCRILDVFVDTSGLLGDLRAITLVEDQSKTNTYKMAKHVRNDHDRVSLGQFQYLFNFKRVANDPIEIKWRDYVCALRNANFLTSRDFTTKLNKLTNQFRNRGTHRVPVTREECIEFMKLVLGSGPEDVSGLLVRILER